MKAKELVIRYHRFLSKEEEVYADQPADASIDETDAAIGVCFLLGEEIKDLAAIRKTATNSAFIAIFKELDQKFQAFCRLINNPDVDASAFRVYLRETFPSIFHRIATELKWDTKDLAARHGVELKEGTC
jgi:hypothetical protein